MQKTFYQICKDGDIKELFEFHKNACQHGEEYLIPILHTEPKMYDGIIINVPFYWEKSTRCNYSHEESYWKSGYHGAFEGDNLEIVEILVDLGIPYEDVQFEALADKNVSNSIVRFFGNEKFPGGLFNTPSERMNPSIYNSRAYLCACIRGDIGIFKYLKCKRELKEYRNTEEPDTTSYNKYIIGLAQKGYRNTSTNEMKTYLEKLYKEYKISI